MAKESERKMKSSTLEVIERFHLWPLQVSVGSASEARNNNRGFGISVLDRLEAESVLNWSQKESRGKEDEKAKVNWVKDVSRGGRTG